jgi:glycosyltransferase involved in cell wall biosynthesis
MTAPRDARPIGIAPFDYDEDNPASRMRGFEVAQALQRLGMDARIARPEQVADYSVLILGRYARYEYGRWWQVLHEARRHGTRVVFDIADNVYSWRGLSRQAVRGLSFDRRLPRYAKFWLEERRMLRFLRGVDCVTVSSTPLRVLTEAHNPRCVVIPDIVGDECFARLKRHRDTRPVRVLWTGFRDNLPHLEVVFEALQRLAPAGGFELCVVTSEQRTSSYRGSTSNREIVGSLPFATRFLPWERERAFEDALTADIAVVPVQSGAAKSSNKAVLFMAMGIPVVASVSYEYLRLIENGRTGFVCDTVAEWTETLRRLLSSAALRDEMGQAARRAVRAEHRAVAVARRWQRLLESVQAAGPAGG